MCFFYYRFNIFIIIGSNNDLPLKADIALKDPKKRSKILEYVEGNPNLNHIIRSIGYVDLEFLFYLKDVNQLHEIMKDLSIKFPDAIKNYTYFSITKTHKWNYLPEK